LGENGRDKKVFILHLPMATKLGTFQWPPSFGSFQWPPSFGSTFTSLLLLFKRRTWMMGSLSLGLEDNFHAILNTCFHKLLEEGNNV